MEFVALYPDSIKRFFFSLALREVAERLSNQNILMHRGQATRHSNVLDLQDEKSYYIFQYKVSKHRAFKMKA
jgi:hypothetical protein